MKVRVLAFATARDALGVAEREVELPGGSTVADLRRLLEADAVALGRMWERLAIAVDGQIVDASAVLAEGSEIALLPPVSGGAASAWLQTEPLDVQRVAARVAGHGFGAIVVFVGTVRDRHEKRPVDGITYTAYEVMAVVTLETIVAELESEASGSARVAIAHRLGSLEVGEASVVIATASAHRDAAYRANREALERLKRRVPIWKREHYGDGSSRWQEEEALVGSPV